MRRPSRRRRGGGAYSESATGVPTVTVVPTVTGVPTVTCAGFLGEPMGELLGEAQKFLSSMDGISLQRRVYPLQPLVPASSFDLRGSARRYPFVHTETVSPR